MRSRTGVFSFARYDADFWKAESEYSTGETFEKSKNFENKNWDEILFRACKVMAHEIGHIFGIKHCVYFNCLMNGSNNETENCNKPAQLCAICLRKLQLNCPFRLKTRYQNLIKACQQLGGSFEKQIPKYQKLLAACQ